MPANIIQIKCLLPSSPDRRFTYNCNNLDSVSVDLLTPISAFPLPQADTGADANVLTKADGNTLRFTVGWVLHDEDSSVVTSDGGTIDTSKYASGAVKTADEQARFLTEDFQSLGVEYQYKIILGTTGIERFGSVERVSLQKSGTTPVTWKAQLTFIAGDVVTV